MRKALISLVIVALMLTFPIAPMEKMVDSYRTPTTSMGKPREGSTDLASAGGFGSSLQSTQYMSRVITGEQIVILNTYADTSTHTGAIDLSSYLYPGWHVYEVTVDVNKMEAAPEREVAGVTYDIATLHFAVEELGTWYAQLAQGFYNQSHNGALVNYSIYYSTTDYTPATRGNASTHINSGYFSGGSFINPQLMTAKVNMTVSDSLFTWATVSGENMQLNTSTIYWAIINGTLLKSYGSPIATYPKIYWGSENAAGSFGSFQKGFSSWDLKPWEALMNYTYTPWNRTVGAPLQFLNPENVDLFADSTQQTGLTWTFTDAVSNITSIQFNTNQSINLDYNITIWYQDSTSSTTNWGVDISGNPIVWNATTGLTYPVFPETTTRYLNVTVPSDWTTSGFYNSTDPGTDYGHNSKAGDIVTCTDITDGIWTISSLAPNYITAVDLYDTSDDSSVIGKVSILVDMDINTTIEDGLSTPMNGGTANLTVQQTGSTIYAPAETTATAGLSSFLWDISTATSGNSTHSIEVFWTNGTEAGYYVTDVFLYYPTTLVADDIVVNAYADNATAFDIGVNFDQDFPVRGLDGSLAAVTYSFDGGVNTSLDDQTGGRWTGTVSTVGKSNGTYQLFVYAEGYVLENQSLTITVDLIYETLPLNWSWSPGNDISYLESTNLTVFYRELDGTNITGAWVNVTFESQTYNLTWDVTKQVYWIELHGVNFTGVPGSISLTVSAWRAGYAPQYNDTLTINIASEPVIDFSVTWNPTNRNITFIEQITISVTYNYNSAPISGAWVRVTFVGYPLVNLIFNPLLEQWEITLNGSDYLGNTSLTVWASLTGYDTKNNSTTLLVMEDIPSLGNSWTSSSSTTDYATDIPLTITVEDSIGFSINDATLIIIVNGVETSYPSGVYTVTITPPQTRGVYTVNVTMVRYGYTTTSVFLTLTVRATTEISINALSHEYEQWNLTVSVTYSDSLYGAPITGATVIMTLDGVDYALAYSGGSYVIEIVLDVAPGTYTLSVSATASLANAASDSVQLTVDSKRAVSLELVSEGDPSAEGQLVSLSATLRYNNSGVLGDPVVGENVYFIVRITFVNGTVEVRDSPSQYDSTNTNGVASWSFRVPAGNIESIQAEVHYYGSRLLWSAQKIIAVGGTSPIMALLFFFFGTDMGRVVIGSIVLLGIVAATYNRRIKPKKRAAKTSLENQLQMFVDLESLRHFMAIYLDRGTCVFYHPFTDERIQPDLISGFIAAITSVYGEIKGDGVRGTLEEIQYHGLRLNSYSGDKIIGILILEGEMTPLLKDRLQFFVELFENQYEMDLDGWTGLVDCFDPEWIVSTLNSAFNYSWLLPHRFGPTQKVSKTDAKILDYIAAVRDDRGEFYIRHLLSPVSEMLDLSEAQVVDRLLALQERGAIVPVGVQTVLQRQGMGLSDGREGKDDFTLELPRTSETSDELEEEPKPARKKKTTPKPKEVTEEPTPEPEVEPIAAVDEVVEEPSPEPEPKEEIDPMEAFVMDVESLLSSREEKDSDTEKEEED